ncbi:MerR family transcriptional regulator [Streptomyces griseoincarnatus]
MSKRDRARSSLSVPRTTTGSSGKGREKASTSVLSRGRRITATPCVSRSPTTSETGPEGNAHIFRTRAAASSNSARSACSPLTGRLSPKALRLYDELGLLTPARVDPDTGYAGSRLLAVADGYGTGGARASAAAVDALRGLESETVPAGDLLGALEDALGRAEQAVHGITSPGDDGADAGTTLTAMLWTGSQLALVHIGDSRVHLLRDGELFQITHDHTVVQSLIDEGRLTPEEAASHPQRSLLMRALGRGADSTPDLRLHDARAGDRYLLCSDGLSTVVPAEDVHRVLADTPGPEDAVRELVDLANASGGPDNVSCVVADVSAPA